MKVLIISHNAITTYQNMGKTLLSLFSAFKKSELCHLYIYPTIPDVDACNSYYRVTDKNVLNSYFQFGRVNSRVIAKDEIDVERHSLYESSADAKLYKKKKRNSLTLLCRDLMWQFSGWYNLSLKDWLESEKPTCIFLAPGESKFIYNIALSIAEKLKINLFTYICDEYYFVHKPHKLLDRIQISLLKNKMKEALTKSKAIITICDELTNEYQNEFGTEAYTIFTGSNYPIRDAAGVCKRIDGLTYMGNLTCNRFRSIAEIGRVLDEINEEKGTDVKLYLYTLPLNEIAQNEFADIRSIKYSGYVTGKDFENAMHSAAVLLHIEAFDQQSIERVKHSISTKIADALGSGNLLFAYGPCEIASIHHLMRNKCAVVVTEQKQLKSTLDGILQKKDFEQIINKSLETARIYHSSEKNSRRLYDILNGSDRA